MIRDSGSRAPRPSSWEPQAVAIRARTASARRTVSTQRAVLYARFGHALWSRGTPRSPRCPSHVRPPTVCNPRTARLRAYQTPPLMLIVPVRTARATAQARSAPRCAHRSGQTIWRIVREADASASPSWAITTSTGPKISSRAVRAALSRPVTSVGSMQNPRVAIPRTPAARRERAALLDGQTQVALDAVALPGRDQRAAHRASDRTGRRSRSS